MKSTKALALARFRQIFFVKNLFFDINSQKREKLQGFSFLEMEHILKYEVEIQTW
jgi:hypothetical protein